MSGKNDNNDTTSGSFHGPVDGTAGSLTSSSQNGTFQYGKPHSTYHFSDTLSEMSYNSNSEDEEDMDPLDPNSSYDDLEDSNGDGPTMQFASHDGYYDDDDDDYDDDDAESDDGNNYYTYRSMQLARHTHAENDLEERDNRWRAESMLRMLSMVSTNSVHEGGLTVSGERDDVEVQDNSNTNNVNKNVNYAAPVPARGAFAGFRCFGQLPAPWRPRKGMGDSYAQKNRVRVKSERIDRSCEFDGLALTQNLRAHDGLVWVMKFSHDGFFLATAGEDGRVLVWSVGKSPVLDDEQMREQENQLRKRRELHKERQQRRREQERQQKQRRRDHLYDGEDGREQNEGTHTSTTKGTDGNVSRDDNNNANGNTSTGNTHENSNSDSNTRTQSSGAFTDGSTRSFRLLTGKPCRVYVGHREDVLDLAWSKTRFLLSASIDKTVRLWHLTRRQCLQLFEHKDMVTCVDFHPFHEGFFMTGAMDRTLRVWNLFPTRHLTSKGEAVLMERHVAGAQGEEMLHNWTHSPDVITAGRFTPDGKMCVVGDAHGTVLFYSYDKEGLRYFTQIECRNSSGPFRTGRQVRGLDFFVRKFEEHEAVIQTGTSVGTTTTTTTNINISVNAIEGVKYKGNDSGAGGDKKIDRDGVTNGADDGDYDRDRDGDDDGNGKKMRRTMADKDGAADQAVPGLSVENPTKSNDMALYSIMRNLTHLLVTTNDDRLRIIDLDKYCITTKYRGLSNNRTIIGGSFSVDGKYVISGSDSGRVHIWNREHTNGKTNFENENFFPAPSGDTITTAIFAPSSAVAKATQINPGIYILDYIPDLSSRIIVASDAVGNIRVFSRGLDA